MPIASKTDFFNEQGLHIRQPQSITNQIHLHHVFVDLHPVLHHCFSWNQVLVQAFFNDVTQGVGKACQSLLILQ